MKGPTFDLPLPLPPAGSYVAPVAAEFHLPPVAADFYTQAAAPVDYWTQQPAKVTTTSDFGGQASPVLLDFGTQTPPTMRDVSVQVDMGTIMEVRIWTTFFFAPFKKF